MKIDGVFAGGGVKAFSFVGALQVMEEKSMEFERVAGTSAGAIVAALIKAGYTSEELFEILDTLNIEVFKDERLSWLPFTVAKWLHMYFKLGLYKGDELEAWLRTALEAKGVSTFADLPKDSIKIVASDLTRGRILVLPDDLPQFGILPEKFSVARAVRMSCSIPFFFEPVKLYDRRNRGHFSYIVDGGLLSNFPLWLFVDKKTKKKRRPVIGFKLTPNINQIPPNEIKNALGMYKALFETMTNAHDTRYIEAEEAKDIIFIPINQDIKATNFSISEEEKEELVQLGRQKTTKFLQKWS
ncbi:patatin-like phospholipase family protein [Alkalihalobacillus sp. 1P02AB]|uniref:patatin-like phospholipase family protein n=1 Tax=Alkalihalobacillus sp. 1P02AB TaxID=3132260 RepID=UPI0039A6DA1A